MVICDLLKNIESKWDLVFIYLKILQMICQFCTKQEKIVIWLEYINKVIIGQEDLKKRASGHWFKKVLKNNNNNIQKNLMILLKKT